MVELDASTSEPHPSSLRPEDDPQEFIPLSAVDLDGEESRGSGSSVGGSGDPWARIGELPQSLGDKMMELRTEG